jgi:Mannitol-1-phosphate/altronate dehydrogenases
MEKTMKRLLLVGMGKVGRGLITPVFQEAGYKVVGCLREPPQLSARHLPYLLETPRGTTQHVFHDTVAMNAVEDTFDLIVTSVGRGNLDRIGRWYEERGLSAPVLLAENLPAAVQAFPHQLPIVVDRICTRAELRAGRITVRTEDYYRIVVLDHPLTRALRKVGNVEVEPCAMTVERERTLKLFTVNTAHLLTAVEALRRGYQSIDAAIRDPEIAARVAALVREVSPLLGLDATEARRRSQVLIRRFATPLQDSPSRIINKRNFASAKDYFAIPRQRLDAMKRPAPLLDEASRWLGRHYAGGCPSGYRSQPEAALR